MPNEATCICARAVVGAPDLLKRMVLLVPFALSLAACVESPEKWIGFYERNSASFSLEISNPASSPQPAELSLAYKRAVYAVVPKKDNAEAKNLISRFSVGGGGAQNGNFELQNGFATGRAAEALASNAAAAKALFGVSIKSKSEIDAEIAFTACIDGMSSEEAKEVAGAIAAARNGPGDTFADQAAATSYLKNLLANQDEGLKQKLDESCKAAG